MSFTPVQLIIDKAATGPPRTTANTGFGLFWFEQVTVDFSTSKPLDF